jgi:ribosomal protein S18 acetylase RimI-like enzyme
MELDSPVWRALQGPQRSLGGVRNGAARFLPEVSPFGAFERRPGPADWEDLAHLTGPGSSVAVIATEEGQYTPPEGWTVSWTSPGAQMVGGTGLAGRTGPATRRAATDPVVSLGPDDVGDMLALVAESRPGPFSSRTVEFGGYVGVRRDGQLVAMAGERLRPPGYAEISAVTTHPGHRRQGLAELLIGTVGAGITARGEVPFLHVAADNTNAIRLYEALGFTLRRTVWFTVLEVPAG